ncbi:MAG: hypothetical protein QME94_07095 [Anaerolineae bacterium]|nr:hypothetical protein [Anaerolineae bacterium]
MSLKADLPLTLTPLSALGGLEMDQEAAPLPGAAWYTAHAAGDGLEYRFAAGALAPARFLTADLLQDGNQIAVFHLTLQEGEGGPTFGLLFGALNQCQARIRMPLEAVNQNRWRYEREGAWLKPICWLDRVDLRRVDRMTLSILRMAEEPVRFCLTTFTATSTEPPALTEPLLPKGPLIDELGQSTLHDWPTKSRSAQEVTARLQAQLAQASAQRWPEGYSRWGGWARRRVEGTGFFRTHHDGRRWWLIDPDGHLFWSAGMDCVRVNTEAAYAGLETALAWRPDPHGTYEEVYSRDEARHGHAINYLAANLIRAFGRREWRARWGEIALAELRRLGFNTVGNWSVWPLASEAGFPYVRPLEPRFPNTPLVFRDFPDVFDPAFAGDAALYAAQLRETANDPAMIGYFLMNEPTWGFARETPAAGMLFNTAACASRRALAEFLGARYASDSRLSAAWGMDATLAAVAEGTWSTPLTPAAESDLASFSAAMTERLFGTLSQACRQVDANHLNLGVRYYTVPPAWALDAMRAFDVFSMNCYRARVPAEEVEAVSARLERPVLVGEWHFGALDVGLPSGGIARVRDQAARGRAFRVYTEQAAALRACVGVHYFTLYDQSALGRFDGECYNIGFLDVTNRPYERLAEAARATHERLYEVALGELLPYDEAPEYLPPVYL